MSDTPPNRPNLGAAINAITPHPMAVALIIINLVFLGASIWFLSELLDGFREVNVRRDALVTMLANRECPAPQEKKQ